jgi:hypothetical protein
MGQVRYQLMAECSREMEHPASEMPVSDARVVSGPSSPMRRRVIAGYDGAQPTKDVPSTGAARVPDEEGASTRPSDLSFPGV